MTNAAQLKITAWSLVAVTVILAVLAWGQTYRWQLLPYSSYRYFPLLGLLAFSLMWTHYISSTLRERSALPKPILSNYFRLTSYAVLLLILLHPGLLIYQRFRDGYGLPPGSYLSYVAPGMMWVAILGSISLVIFLAFELHRVYGDRSWWHYVADASDFAMLAIFYHSLRLGTQLNSGWYRGVWWFYGLTLIMVLARKYYLKFKKPRLLDGA